MSRLCVHICAMSSPQEAVYLGSVRYGNVMHVAIIVEDTQ